jgi:Lipase (class 3)
MAQTPRSAQIPKKNYDVRAAHNYANPERVGPRPPQRLTWVVFKRLPRTVCRAARHLWSGAIRAGGDRLPTYFNDQVTGVNDMDPTELLTLAAISYRGCEFNLSNPHGRKIVYDEISRCLREFPSVRDKFQIAWGPAGYNPGRLDLDDSAMYVVLDKRTFDLAIIIRGTNFFSLGDWLTNLRIDPEHWESGGAGSGATITHSTAYGLKILQQLKAEPGPPSDTGQSVKEIEDAAALAAKAVFVYQLLEAIFRGVHHEDLAGLVATVKTLIENIVEARQDFAQQEAVAFGEAAASQPAAPAATTLIEFLKNYVGSANAPVKVWVVGHSKGGALAPALALWLAESRGANTGNWDPRNRATLHLATFADPTPGNGNFAERVQHAMASTYRLANPYDIAPHVWAAGEAARIPTLYGIKLLALEPLASLLVLRLRRYGYEHESSAESWPRPSLVERPLLTQIAVNHLDAYLQKLGIYDGQLNTLAVFAPIRV